MKRISIIVLGLFALSLSLMAQTPEEQQPVRDYNTLKALSFGIGLPFECRDLPGAGLSFHIGYDCAYPINNQLALGFYLNGAGGFWSEYKRFSKIDNEHVTMRLSAGLLLRIGEADKRPFLVGIAPCTGFGLHDMDLTLPLEIRFGRYLTDRWYIMGELTYNISLAKETACIEPAIKVGYNFGRKIKAKK